MNRGRLKGALAFALAASVLAAAAPAGPASAHVAGSEPVAREGSLVLGPATPGSVDNQLHVFVEQGLQFPVQPEDTLAWNWSVNGGLGPAIVFTIHNHLNGTTTFYSKTAANDSGSWLVVSNVTLMVSFENPTAYNVTLNYSFVLYAPPVALSWLVFVFPAAAGLAVGWFIWVRAGRPPEEGGLDEAFPTDPRAKRAGPGEEE
jgi:hypothetical protein